MRDRSKTAEWRPGAGRRGAPPLLAPLLTRLARRRAAAGVFPKRVPAFATFGPSVCGASAAFVCVCVFANVCSAFATLCPNICGAFAAFRPNLYGPSAALDCADVSPQRAPRAAAVLGCARLAHAAPDRGRPRRHRPNRGRDGGGGAPTGLTATVKKKWSKHDGQNEVVKASRSKRNGQSIACVVKPSHRGGAPAPAPAGPACPHATRTKRPRDFRVTPA